jgi:hypothetical protein
MTADQYVVWFIAMAVAIALILSLGTMQMAGILKRQHRDPDAEQQDAQVIEHHRWYDRFHHHAA